MKENLNITHEREYYAITCREGFQWNHTCKHPPYKCLAAAMRRNADLRIMFATGYYDMACQIGQTRYLVSHGDYPKERVEIHEYPSGHMAYLGEESTLAFAADVRSFIKFECAKSCKSGRRSHAESGALPQLFGSQSEGVCAVVCVLSAVLVFGGTEFPEINACTF